MSIKFMCTALSVIVLMATLPLPVRASSEARFPADWKQWQLVKSIELPSAETKIPKYMSPLYKETVRRYNWVYLGKSIKLDIYVNPAVMDEYIKGGPYPDGFTAVVAFREANVIFVTEHRNNKAIYGAYDEKGHDITKNHSSFNPKTCAKCHYFYKECRTRYGICTQLPDKPVQQPISK